MTYCQESGIIRNRNPVPNDPVVVLAPHGRDAAVIVGVLQRAELRAEAVPDLATLVQRIAQVPVVVLTEEVLAGDALPELLRWVAAQSPWSDLPFIVLVTKQVVARRAGRAATLEGLGNAVLLERPLNAESLESAARSALRARGRQLAMRDLAQSLEDRVVERTQALTDSEARFRAVFEGFPAALFVISVDKAADFRFEGFNPFGERRTGLRNRDVAGKRPEAFMDPEQAALMRHALERSVATGSGTEFTEELTFPAGAGTFEITLTPMRDRSGRIFRVLGVANDVTERNRLEARLRQAQKLEAVGQLTGGVAHDFNNLLQVVLSGLTLMERVQDPGRRAQLADSVRRAAERGGELTKRLLTVARRQSLKPEAVDLAVWLNDGAGALLARTLRGDIVTVLEIEPGLPPVQVDPEELELAVLNLAVNARDAMPEGGTLTISAESVTFDVSVKEGLSGRFVCLAIADSGVGMSAETLARVFEPFFTTKEVGKGTGLGLAQVYGFAKQSGGEVRLMSGEGVGTTVSLLLPIAYGAVAAASAPAADPGGTPLLGASVLVVEDDDDVAALVVDMLTQLGQRPTRVATAAAALGALADDRRVDLLFTDVLMPGGMDGLTLAREAGRRRPGLPVLLTTGYSGSGTTSPASDFPILRKPYRIDELAHALQRVMVFESQAASD